MCIARTQLANLHLFLSLFLLIIVVVFIEIFHVVYLIAPLYHLTLYDV